MLRLFGPVYSRNPDQLCIPYNDSRTAQVYEQLSASSIIYDHLIPDLNAAEDCLAEYDPIVTEGPLASTVSSEDNFTRYRQLRLNYYATILLKARIYLWAGDTENALIEARKLTDDPQVRAWFPAVDPNTLLGNTVNPDRTFSTECLLDFMTVDETQSSLVILMRPISLHHPYYNHGQAICHYYLLMPEIIVINHNGQPTHSRNIKESN